MGTGAVNRDELERDLRERAFRRSADGSLGARDGGVPAIGLEIELLPVWASSGERVPVVAHGSAPGTGELLERAAERSGWGLAGRDGVPAVVTPGQARISFEPGGQLEYSSSSFTSLDHLLCLLREEIGVVRESFARQEVALVARGMDPAPGPGNLPLQLETPRYRRMARSFAPFEPAGRLMMRHTASIHVNVDWTDDPCEEWDLANRLTPVFAALFANSPTFLGRATGYRSYRTSQWAHLDPLRSGPVRGDGGDPVGEYLEFALAAPAFLMGPEEASYVPFSRWMGNGSVSREDWESHLSTLFPEVRPRGYLEFRSVDALPLEWVAVPPLLLRGLLHHPPTRRRVRHILPPASRRRLEEAARQGLREPGQRKTAEAVARLGVEGARALGAPGQEEALRRAEAFVETFVGRGRDPGDAEGKDSF